jgi:hypothetical protein
LPYRFPGDPFQSFLRGSQAKRSARQRVPKKTFLREPEKDFYLIPTQEGAVLKVIFILFCSFLIAGVVVWGAGIAPAIVTNAQALSIPWEPVMNGSECLAITVSAGVLRRSPAKKYRVRIAKNLFYFLKPFVPRWLQIALRNNWVLRKKSLCANIWPIDEMAGKPPKVWLGWPEGKRFALALTHDVETAKGMEKCLRLVRLEENLGFRSCFNFVAEDYRVSGRLRENLIERGFEVGVHGLRHNGNPFRSQKVFQDYAGRINRYLREWDAVGHRCPSMYHDLDLIGELEVKYDSSTFDTDPFEPQPDGAGTIFPFWVARHSGRGGYVELPYTLPQDFTLFILMKERGIDIWKKKLDWIAKKGGLAMMIVHPDYMNFDGGAARLEEFPADHYVEFLEYVKNNFGGQYWHALPRDIADYWASHFGEDKK